MHASILAVRDPHTEQALAWESKVFKLFVQRKVPKDESAFGLSAKSCRCFNTQAFWLCVDLSLNKRFRGKVMFLVACTAQSSVFGFRPFQEGAFTRKDSGCEWFKQ